MNIAKLVTIQFDGLDRVFQVFQDRIKVVLDTLCNSPLAHPNLVPVTFPDSKHPTLHADGTTGYDANLAHGMGISNPRFVATSLAQVSVAPGLTTADMTKAIISTSPDNNSKNLNKTATILLTSNQPSVSAVILFF